MDVGAYLILSDLDLAAKSRFKDFEDITLDDFKVLEPDLIDGFGVILFRDFRTRKGLPYGRTSREKILRRPNRLPSRHNKKKF
jgi:hypothetical protein